MALSGTFDEFCTRQSLSPLGLLNIHN